MTDTIARNPDFAGLRIYGDLTSGNCLKIKIVADHLGIPYEWVEIDALKGESRTPSYRALFPAGQIPGVTFEDGRRLAQSNAIIRYLARDSALLPDDAFLSATVDQWLFWEQYSHEPTIAVCRAEMKFRGVPRDGRDSVRIARGEAALDLMERHLTGADWFVGDDRRRRIVRLHAMGRRGWVRPNGQAGDPALARPMQGRVQDRTRRNRCRCRSLTGSRTHNIFANDAEYHRWARSRASSNSTGRTRSTSSRPTACGTSASSPCRSTSTT